VSRGARRGGAATWASAGMRAPQRTQAPPPGSPAGSACSEQAPAGAAAPGGTAPPHAPQRRPTSSASAAALAGSQHAPHLPRARSCRWAPLHGSTGAPAHTEQELCVTPADPCMSCSLLDSWRSFILLEVLHRQPPCPWP